ISTPVISAQHAAAGYMAKTQHVRAWSTYRSAAWTITPGFRLASSSMQKIARHGTTRPRVFLTTSACPRRRLSLDSTTLSHLPVGKSIVYLLTTDDAGRGSVTGSAYR